MLYILIEFNILSRLKYLTLYSAECATFSSIIFFFLQDVEDHRVEGKRPSTIMFFNLDRATCRKDSSWIQCYPIGSICIGFMCLYRIHLGSGEHLVESGRIVVVEEPAV